MDSMKNIGYQNINVFATRTNQMDALSLDKAMNSLLKSQLDNCFRYLQHNSLIKVEPELTALLKLIVWRFTILSKGATIGQQLLSIQYRNVATKDAMSLKKSWILGVSLIGASWLKQRLFNNSLISNISLRQSFIIFVDFLEFVLSIGNLLNFLIFIHNGKFISIIERVFGVGSMSSAPQVLREVQYEYMNRELLWHGFAEFLSFILPIINLQRIINITKRIISTQSVVPDSSVRCTYDLQKCVICKHWPTFPHDIGCQHVFCYYCIMSNVMADPHYKCPVCRFGKDISVKPVSTLQ